MQVHTLLALAKECKFKQLPGSQKLYISVFPQKKIIILPIKIMRTVFEILPESVDTENSVLLCEVNNEGFSFGIKNETENFFSGLGIYHYDKSRPPVGLPIALQVIFHQKEIFSKKFKKTRIVYSFPQSVLVPFSVYNSSKNGLMMNMMHGDLHSNETLLTDVIASQYFYNCYRIPSALHEVLQSQFPGAVSMHQYTHLLKMPVGKNDRLSVIFYSQKIIVFLVKNEKYHLINSFNYRSPEDVSYILLNICRQFNINGIQLEMSGLIEESSALYKEVYKFFTDIQLAALPEGISFSEEITRYPSHYFSYIFAIDSCE
jgi:hypothetical protein